MNSHPAHNLGQYGEKLAASYLIRQGFSILAQNFRYKRWEIDIIVQNKQLIVFVEVKARKNSRFGYPEQFVHAKKKNAVRSAALHYLAMINMEHHPIRFDTIAILGHPSSKIEVMHFMDSFY